MVLTVDLHVSYEIHMALINMHHRNLTTFFIPNNISLHNNPIYFSGNTHGAFQFEVLASNPFKTGKSWFYISTICTFQFYFQKRETATGFSELGTAELGDRLVWTTCEKPPIWIQTVHCSCKGHPFINHAPYYPHLISPTQLWNTKRKRSSLKSSFAGSSCF